MIGHFKSHPRSINLFMLAALFVVVLPFLAGCGGGDESASRDTGQDSKSTPGTVASSIIQGEVTETMESGGYTYVNVKTSSGTVWAAGPVTPIKVGDPVRFETGMVMRNFESKTLQRSFDEIYFVSAFDAPMSKGATGQTNTPGPMAGIKKPAERADVGDVERAPGGQTIAEIQSGRKDLAGKTVKVRGVVVKFNAGIMGRNWMHIQDGSCAEGPCDLTVTTDENVAVGDLVMIQGVLAIDKDFGAGYSYEAIVENAVMVGD
jgi:hypothetical protein